MPTQVDWASKEELIAALESGKYQKTKGKLYRPTPLASRDWSYELEKYVSTESTGHGVGYCCIGVLCRISGLADKDIAEMGYISFGEAASYEVLTFQGVVSNAPDWLPADTEGQLASINDGCMTWEPVINYLRNKI